MLSLNLNTSYKSHIIVGLLVSIWLVAFLVFVGPFDAAELSFNIRLLILPPYGVIFFICYMVVVATQNWIYKRLNYWNLFLELIIISLIYISVLYSTFLYYKSGIINGDWTFGKYFSSIYLPTWVEITN